MKLPLFNGGLHTKLAEHLIQPTESIVCVNVDLDKGLLTAVNGYSLTETVTEAKQYGYYYATEDKWYKSDTPADWLEYQGNIYESDRLTRPKYYSGETPVELGLLPLEETTDPIDPEDPLPETPLINISLSALGSPPNVVPPVEIVKASIFTNPNPTVAVNRTYTYLPVKAREVEGIVLRSLGEVEDVYLSGSGTLAGNIPYDESDNPYLGIAFKNSLADANLLQGDTIELYRRYLDKWILVDSQLIDLAPELQPGLWFLLDDKAPDEANELVTEGLTGTYQYAITYENRNTGVESAPFVTDEITVESQKIRILGTLRFIDITATHVNVYRIGNSITTFTRVVSIPNIPGTGGDPTLFNLRYTDELDDNELEGQLLATVPNAPIGGPGTVGVGVPKRLRYLTESYAVFFAVVDFTDAGYQYPNRLYFTPVNDPNSWPVLNFLTFPLTITGIAVVANGILVCTIEKTYLVTGTTPIDFNQFVISSSQGCVSHESIALIGTTALWVSREGICISDGTSVDLLTATKLDLISFDPVNAVVFNQKYYLQLTDGYVFEADLGSGKFRYLNLGTWSLVVGKGKLYGFYPEEALYRELLVDSENKLPMEYKSPKFIGDGYVSSKIYNYIYITTEGQIDLQIYIDSVLVQTYYFTGTIEMHEVKVPQIHMRGYAVQFRVTGKGTVYEIYINEGSPNN